MYHDNKMTKPSLSFLLLVVEVLDPILNLFVVHQDLELLLRPPLQTEIRIGGLERKGQMFEVKSDLSE